MSNPPVGTVGWVDLTVDDAESVRDFYAGVVGWTSEPVDMGEYADFNMLRSDGEAAAGICFQRGANEGIAQKWMIYVTVACVQLHQRVGCSARSPSIEPKGWICRRD